MLERGRRPDDALIHARSSTPPTIASTGVGGSAAPRFPYLPWTLTQLSARLLDQFGYQQVDVLGVSWGGVLAQQFAFQKNKRCRRLVLAATSPGSLMVRQTYRAAQDDDATAL
jgi:pimeloyl-ACP methyl ester carboxylesterase